MDKQDEHYLAILSQQLHTAEKLKEVNSSTVVKLAYVMTALVNSHAELVRSIRTRHHFAATFPPNDEDETPEHYANITSKDLEAFVNLDTKVNELVAQLEHLLKTK